MDSAELKAALALRAAGLGFAECRVARAELAAHHQEYRDWLAKGFHGDMAWMERNADRREDPRVVLETAKSVVVLAMNYHQGEREFHPQYRIARYAWNDDYHDLIEPRLRELETWLEQRGGRQRRYVDTGPMLERSWATRSGLGWGGKSTVQIHPKLGAWFFLSEIITTLEIEADQAMPDRCGKCSRCMTACPTSAIVGERQLDARRCLSYLSIEFKGSIPLEFRRAMGTRIYGCDDCLLACPWNRFASLSRESAFSARESVAAMDLRDFLALDDLAFRRLFAASPIKRIKRPAFLRNVCVALGNSGNLDDLPALESAAQDPSPLISEHALWALQEIKGRAASAEAEA